jgi:hypothetical protein
MEISMDSEGLPILLEGPEANEASVQAMRDWVRRESLGIRIERPTLPAQEGTMGADLATVLTAILGSASVIQLVKSLHTWMIVRRPKIKLTIAIGKDKVQLDGENVEELDSVLSRMPSIIDAVKK